MPAEPCFTIGQPVEASALLAGIARQLAGDGPDDPRRDARLLLGLALGRDDAVFPHETVRLDAAAAARLDALIRRRRDGEPVARLRGWREFYSLRFQLNAATLDPRPDSEVLVEAAIAWLATRPAGARVVDFGTGSGCLLLTVLAHCPEASGVAVDISREALDGAAGNAAVLGLDDRVQYHHGHWDDGLDGRFDVVLSNPPYIATEAIAELMPEVRLHDPMAALDGGTDGFDGWRALMPAIARRLRPGGRGFVEIGIDQHDQVKDLAADNGLTVIDQHRDLAGIIRCLVLVSTQDLKK